MLVNMRKIVNSPYAHRSITQGGFLFKEMRVVSKLLVEGLSDEDVYTKITEDNLFQYPTEKYIRGNVGRCLLCLKLINSSELISRIAFESNESTYQMCLYSMMKYSRLVWDFMVSVIGEKYRNQNTNFTKGDINVFFTRLQEQDDAVASWSEATISKYKSIIKGGLVSCGFLNNIQSQQLNYILIDPALERAIRVNGDMIALPAFNCIGE